jgi:hypothetical protein
MLGPPTARPNLNRMPVRLGNFHPLARAVRVCTFRQISGLKSQAPTRPITYMRVMRGEGLAGGSAETSLATARPFSSPHGSERHWSARQRLPRSKVSRWFDETVRSHRADRLGLDCPGRAFSGFSLSGCWHRFLAAASSLFARDNLKA